MKKAMFFILCFYLTLMVQMLFPYWWTAALMPGLMALCLANSNKQAFVEGGGAVASLWLIFALYTRSTTEGLLSQRVAVIMHIPHEFILLFITFLIAWLVGGCGAVIGFQLKALWGATFKIARQ